MAEQAGKPNGSAPSRSRLGSLESKAGRWTHRVAWVSLLAALATLVVGATVTSYSAGMAVPDWPTTFGHNPLFYPLADWVGVWDVFLEHTHRLLGFLLGGLTVVLGILVWRTDQRPGVRRLGLAAVLVYSAQECLGGFRVLCDEILLANLHACTGPALLAILAVLVIRTSPGRCCEARVADETDDRGIGRWLFALVGGVYLQLVLGAQLRHLPVDAAIEWFGLWIWLHLIVAGAVLVLATVVGVRVRRHLAGERRLRRLSAWLLVLVLTQLALGAATWITQFGWPGWFTGLVGAINYTVVAEGRLQVWATTGHVVVGSLCLIVALAMAAGEKRG